MWSIEPHYLGRRMRGASGDALQHMKSWGRHCVPRKSPRPFNAKVSIIGIPGLVVFLGRKVCGVPAPPFGAKSGPPKKGGHRDRYFATTIPQYGCQAGARFILFLHLPAGFNPCVEFFLGRKVCGVPALPF